MANEAPDIILSLVRTRHVGYLRDIRRLTVALSRARLGLYILGRREVFEACPELQDAFRPLFKRPTDKLQLVLQETFPTDRQADLKMEDEQGKVAEMEGVEHLGQYVFEMTKAKVQALREGREKPPEKEEGTGVDADEDDEAGQGNDEEVLMENERGEDVGGAEDEV